MKKKQTIKHSATTGRYAPKPLGKAKAEKLSMVDGMMISRESAKTLSDLEGRGLKGDALRSAIRESFIKKSW